MTATARPVLGQTAVRPSWDTLPAALRDGIAARLGGTAEHAQSQSGGFTPGLAVRLVLAGGGRVFVKALPAGHPVAASYQHEARSAARLPPAVPAPALRWHAEIDGWTVLAYSDVQGRHPGFGSPAADLPAVLRAVTAAQVPVTGLPPSASHRAGWLHGWAALSADPPTGLNPWAAERLGNLADAETNWLPHADGPTLVHGDLRPDNILITSNGSAVLIDWAHATTGAPWLDLADIAAQLIIAGHHPADAEQIVATHPAWQAAPPAAISGYATALAGYWTRSAALPDPPGVPSLRPYQAHASASAIRWLAWRLSRSGSVAHFS
jgi:aminoglycoside phosphotransferase (APT) family kinase protein